MDDCVSTSNAIGSLPSQFYMGRRLGKQETAFKQVRGRLTVDLARQKSSEQAEGINAGIKGIHQSRGA